MHRNPLLKLLHDYGRNHPQETAVTHRLMAFVRAHPDCCQNSLTIGHVTGSAWVVNEAGSHVLLTHHRKLDRWLQLGGHADGEMDLLAVAWREAREESGIVAIEPVTAAVFDLDIHPIPARGAVPAHDHYDVRFAFRVNGPAAFRVSDESHALAWMPIAELTKTADESIGRMARKWLAKKWLTKK